MTANQIRTLIAIHNWQRTGIPHRPYRLVELMKLFRADAAATALVLRLSGWRKDRIRQLRRNRRHSTTWWIPPGGRPLIRRRRGRPSFADLLTPTERKKP